MTSKEMFSLFLFRARHAPVWESSAGTTANQTKTIKHAESQRCDWGTLRTTSTDVHKQSAAQKSNRCIESKKKR